jgi:hypothetical protein
MLSFSQFLIEMPYLMKHYDKEEHRLQTVGPYTKENKYMLGNHISTHSVTGHHIYMRSAKMGRKRYVNYSAVDPKTGNMDLRVGGSKIGKHYVVTGVAARSGNTLKADDFYEHLVKRHRLIIHSDDTHSEGGSNLWKRMAKKLGVSMKHYDPGAPKAGDRANPPLVGKELPLHKDGDWKKNYADAHSGSDNLITSRFKISSKHRWFKKR